MKAVTHGISIEASEKSPMERTGGGDCQRVVRSDVKVVGDALSHTIFRNKVI